MENSQLIIISKIGTYRMITVAVSLKGRTLLIADLGSDEIGF